MPICIIADENMSKREMHYYEEPNLVIILGSFQIASNSTLYQNIWQVQKDTCKWYIPTKYFQESSSVVKPFFTTIHWIENVIY